MATQASDLVDVVLVSAGEKLINVIKEVRALTGSDLRTAKDLAQQTPSVVASGVPRPQAELALAEFEKIGATVELRTSTGERIMTTGGGASLDLLVQRGILTENEQLDAKVALDDLPPEEFRAMVRMVSELFDLYKQGILSEGEFNTKKWEVLARK